MSEKKLTNEELKTALTTCAYRTECFYCGRREGSADDCRKDLMRQAIARIYQLEIEIERYKTVNKLLEQDVADLHAEREKRVEEVYADFMQDYKIMRDELNECYDENGRLQEALRSIPQAICDNTYPDFDKAGKPVNVWKAREGYGKIDEIIKAVGI